MTQRTTGAGKRTGRYQLLRQLLADGVECIFGNPGSSEENLLDAMRDPEFRRLKYRMALHEGAVVAIADAYARCTQRPAIVQLHSYAGLANGLGMMKYAHRGYTPMVVLAGEAGLRYEALDGQMAGDLIGMARPFVKSDHNGPCAWRAVDPGSILRLMRRALKTAAAPPKGPVFLSLPMDVLDAENTEPIVPTSMVHTIVAPEDQVIAQAARFLAVSNQPLILMGDGIAASKAQKELVEVAELLGAEVWGANCSEVNMPATHPLFAGFLGHMFGEASTPITSAADAVLVCGTTILPEVFPALQGVFAPNAQVIHFDLNVTELAKNFPVAIAAVADPKVALGRLAKALRGMMKSDKLEAARMRIKISRKKNKERHQKEVATDDAVANQIPLRASRFFRDLAKRLPKNAMIFDEALTHSPELCRYVSIDTAGTYFQTRAGMLGTGIPGAIGLKMAHPDRTVFGFSGDGGSISTIQALATAARYGIGAKFVVCNNRSYRILKYNLIEYRRQHGLPLDEPFPPDFDLHKPQLRFDLLARGQGILAARIERPDQIEPALDRALKDDRPFLIDLVVDGAL